jgi:hypothetical protein
MAIAQETSSKGIPKGENSQLQPAANPALMEELANQFKNRNIDGPNNIENQDNPKAYKPSAPGLKR